MTETFATITADAEQLNRLIDLSSLDGDTSHDDLYLNILDNRVEVLQTTGGEVVITYNTFHDDFFDELELEIPDEYEARTATLDNGDTVEYQVGVEAIINAERTQDYLNHAGQGRIRLEFTGHENDDLASYLNAEGALEAWVNLPGSKAALDKVPFHIPHRFVNNIYVSPDGKEAPTIVDVDVSQIEKLISAVDTVDDEEYFPLVVRDGEFWIDIGDPSGSGIKGELTTENVDGPDIENYYYDGFKEIFTSLSGKVQLQTGPGNNPVSIVKSDDRSTIRHINGTVEGQ